jgi:hypothetical protein
MWGAGQVVENSRPLLLVPGQVFADHKPASVSKAAFDTQVHVAGLTWTNTASSNSERGCCSMGRTWASVGPAAHLQHEWPQ